MKKSLIVILLAFWSVIGFCQNKYYHLLDYTCSSCWPSILVWNVDISRATAFGNYVEEYTDSLQRVTKLLCYFDNKNKRAVIDDWDYIVFEYTDSSIIVTELVSPQWWYPIYLGEIDTSDFLYGCPEAKQSVIVYDNKDEYHHPKQFTYQTIRGWEYYATQLVDCNYYPTYEQAYEYVKSHFIYTEEPDTTIRIYRESYDAYVPFYSYSFFKNGLGEAEPMGVFKKVKLTY